MDPIFSHALVALITATCTVLAALAVWLRARAKRTEKLVDVEVEQAKAEVEERKAETTGAHKLADLAAGHTKDVFAQAIELVREVRAQADADRDRADQLARDAIALAADKQQIAERLAKVEAELVRVSAERDQQADLRRRAERERDDMRAHIAQLEAEVDHLRATRPRAHA